MDIRALAATTVGDRPAEALRRLNARHPWSHNDAFHPWILTRLPRRREWALDVGCGRGELLAVLASEFDEVLGLDADAEMRERAAARCAGLPNARVSGTRLEDVDGGVDLVTMVAVLHHLDLEAALTEVRRLVRPGGTFLCVGLAPPASLVDHVWDVASVVTNPAIGLVRHPWARTDTTEGEPFPVRDPEATFDRIRRVAERILPGTVMRHHLGFRHTIEWTAPSS